MTHPANSPSIATAASPDADLTADGKGGYSLTSDAQPYWDDCSTRDAVALSGKNIGDELNAAGLSWGWFQGGFRPTTTYQAALEATGHAGQPTSTFIPDEFTKAGFQTAVPHSSNQGICDAVSPVGEAFGGNGQYGYKDDYIPHHEPFQYYASTANPHHLTSRQPRAATRSPAWRRSGATPSPTSDGVPQFNTPNHNYDMSDFDQLVRRSRPRAAGLGPAGGQLPQGARLRGRPCRLLGPGRRAGIRRPHDQRDHEHAGLAPHADRHQLRRLGWLVRPRLQRRHNPSLSPADNLTNTTLRGPTSGLCGPPQASGPLGGEQGRCGFGPRLPMLVISPFAKHNYVDHNPSDQASTINFVEYNWNLEEIPGSFDQALASTDEAEHAPFDLAGMFDFEGGSNAPVAAEPPDG